MIQPVQPRIIWPRPTPPVEYHLNGCQCPACEPYVPSIPPRLTAVDLARLSVLGFAAGVIGAFLMAIPS